LGADEFIVLIEDVSDSMDDTSRKVGLVAEKIRQSLASPYYCNGHPLLSSPSIGVSLYRGNEKSADVIVQHADMAMYQAKSAGRNSIRFFDPVMQKKGSRTRFPGTRFTPRHHTTAIAFILPDAGRQ